MWRGGGGGGGAACVWKHITAGPAPQRAAVGHGRQGTSHPQPHTSYRCHRSAARGRSAQRSATVAKWGGAAAQRKTVQGKGEGWVAEMMHHQRASHALVEVSSTVTSLNDLSALLPPKNTCAQGIEGRGSGGSVCACAFATHAGELPTAFSATTHREHGAPAKGSAQRVRAQPVAGCARTHTRVRWWCGGGGTRTTLLPTTVAEW